MQKARKTAVSERFPTIGFHKKINSLISRSDKHLISPYNINSESKILVTGIKDMITNLEPTVVRKP